MLLINELNEITKRRNQAITKTAATVISNYTNSVNNTNNNNNNLENPLSLIMNKSNFVSSLKPIKVTLNKKDKKDSFGVVLGCQFYIKDIIPNSSAASEANLCRGDILVKLNDLTSEQLTLNEAIKTRIASREKRDLELHNMQIQLQQAQVEMFNNMNIFFKLINK